MNNIYIVGFMGTGKSAVGRQLAKIKKWHFADLDEFIELRQKRRIVDIFAKYGEAYFRGIEKKALKEVSAQDKFVVACGGGVVLDKHNIKLMKKTGMLICLSATPAEILKRVSAETHRPLLNVKNPLKRIELLLKMRAPFYMQADCIVDTSKLTIKQVMKKIIKVTSKKKEVRVILRNPAFGGVTKNLKRDPSASPQDDKTRA